MFNRYLANEPALEQDVAVHVSFPSIDHFRSFLKELRREYRNTPEEDIPKSFELTGTVKLHGTHADIVFKRRKDDGYDVWCQSRNRVISVENDNCGFAAFVNALPDSALQKMFSYVETIYGDSRRDFIETLVISGEFCGGNIQKKVALEKLDKMFVIYDVKINGVRQPFERYGNLDCEEYRIYNIYRGGSFATSFTLDDSEAVVAELQKITEDVEKECPFAKSFGVTGIGEGVVWKCVLPGKALNETFDSSRFWFKVKGEEHAGGKVKTLEQSKDAGKIKSANEFVSKAVLRPRLEQGLDYLREMNLSPDMKNLGTFLKWVVADVFKEEGDVVADLGLDEKMVKAAITQKAKDFYLKNMALEEPENPKPT